MAEATAQKAPQQSSGGSGGSGLDPKVAILLSWLFAPLASILFIAMEKENYRIKFHAWQSLFYSIASWVVATVISTITLGLGSCIAIPVVLVLPIIAIVKAWNGEDWEMPLIGEWAKNQANK